MTDRALLELAAKAAGLTINAKQQAERDKIVDASAASLWLTDGTTAWNPIKHDSDALHLAVKLRLSIESDASVEVGYYPGIGGEYDIGVEVWLVHADGTSTTVFELYDKDPHAATRRAIVRAAAEIGKELK